MSIVTNATYHTYGTRPRTQVIIHPHYLVETRRVHAGHQ